MNSYTFYFNLYDIAFLGAIFIGLTFTLLLWFTSSVNRSANRFLALALVSMILWMIRILAIDLQLETYLPGWNRVPMQFLLAIGPLLYLYVLKITNPKHTLRRKDLIHFSPMLLEQAALVLEIRESVRTGAVTYHTYVFQQLNPIIQLLIFISVISYLYLCRRVIQRFYRNLQPVLMDRPLVEFRWLRRLLTATALLWFLWILCAAVDYYGYRHQPGIRLYYPFYICFVVMIIWTAAAAFLKPQAAALIQTTAGFKPSGSSELKAKGAWLKRLMETKFYYKDPELSLTSLAEKLQLHSNELSRIINSGLKKSFNDFINEYRVLETARKIQDADFDHMTLLGIAFESGFNSKTTFNRIFKEMTGKSPTEYKKQVEKERPKCNLGRQPRSALLILQREPLKRWVPEKLNSHYMFRSYVKIAWRNLLHNKVYSVINISGMAIGLASSILILLWVKNERSFDRFHKNAGQIYRITGELGDMKAAVNSQAMPAGIKQEIPAIENTVRLSLPSTVLFEASNRKFEEKRVLYADPSFMDVFSFPLVAGDRATALSNVDGVLITQDIAKKYFGNENPIGKILRKDNQENVVVTGVLANIPANSDLQFDFIMPMAVILKTEGNQTDNWENFNFYSYIQLAQSFDPTPANLSALEKQMKQIFIKHSPMPVTFHLQPLTSIHLAPALMGDMQGHGNAQYVTIFFITAILILIVACINFMNLATARSARRAKEIGLRKVAGAVRGQLILQFLSEAVFVSFLSLLLALVVVLSFLPAFNKIADKTLVIPFANAGFWLTLLGITLLAGLVSGSYPALILSGFNPVKVFKGNTKSGSGNLLFRNALVVIQFTASIILLVGTVVIYNQLTFIKDRNPGFEKSNLLYMPIKGDLWNRQQALKNELKQNPLTTDFTVTSDLPANLLSGNGSADWEGKNPNLQMNYTFMDVNEDFIDVFKLKLVNGRSFSRSFPADSNNFMVNEKMLGIMGLDATKAVGKKFSYTGRSGTIVGVVKDFNFKPVQQAIEPLILRYNKDGGFLIVRTMPGKNDETIKALSKISQELNPSYPFKFDFLDQEMANLYKGEQQMGGIFNLFAVLGIFIASLGLYGLSAFMAEQRTKEIGVRKVLGASVVELVYLLSAGITKLILIAIVIAIPLSWWAVNSWLANFAYHVQVSWLVFFVTSLGALGIAWLTVSYESVKVAIVNPVRSLRTE
ncbi:MAG: ABC transporter permease [Agriterribacter sp.]